MNPAQVCLTIMAKGPEEDVLRAANSARELAHSMVLVVAPGDPLLALRGRLPFSHVRIVEEPWIGHSATRSRSIEIAGEDPNVEWSLILDAHSTISGTLPPSDDADAFEVAVFEPISRWRWIRFGHLERVRMGFHWIGAVHEQLVAPPGARMKPWHGHKPWRGLTVRGSASPKTTGGRTYANDAELLRACIEKDPCDARAVFYFAQSLKDAGLYREAFNAFERRSHLGGWSEEVFWSLLWRARLAPLIGEDPIPLYLLAHEHSSERAEPLDGLSRWYRSQAMHDLAKQYGELAWSKPFPEAARLFVDLNAYNPDISELFR